ncbi:MAG: hypothetical protein AB7V26_15635 [Lysobacterales bacterium]
MQAQSQSPTPPAPLFRQRGYAPWAAVPPGFQAGNQMDAIGTVNRSFDTSSSGRLTVSVTNPSYALPISINNRRIVRGDDGGVVGRYGSGEPARPMLPSFDSAPAVPSASPLVGASSGSFRVDESGAATYSLPIIQQLNFDTTPHHAWLYRVSRGFARHGRAPANGRTGMCGPDCGAGTAQP